ncbi:MAG: hypothetical protein BMS9Abin05_0938 [Rhodothermia bacterium]|nr:MAG: hypothetical protein BMS9Abin05_0938 [Rhodothermia bacterium]
MAVVQSLKLVRPTVVDNERDWLEISRRLGEFSLESAIWGLVEEHT